jgi:hypothetical protein
MNGDEEPGLPSIDSYEAAPLAQGDAEITVRIVMGVESSAINPGPERNSRVCPKTAITLNRYL